MPIQISTFKTKKEINPKYFTQTFTGDGNRKSGLLSPYRKVFMEGIFEGRKYEMNKKTKSNSNGVSKEEIVLDPILYNQYLNIEYIDLEKLKKIEDLIRIEDSSKTNDKIYMSVSVLNTDYTKTPSENKDKKVSLNTIYKFAFFRKTNKDQVKMISYDKEKRSYPFFFDGSPTFLNSHYNSYLKRIENLKENTGIFYFTNNPKAMIDAIENNYKTDFDFEKIENYLSPLTDYDLFLKAAYKWNDDLKDYLDFYLNASIRKDDNSFYNNFPIMDFIELLETYNIDLEVYQKVYEILENRVPNMVKDLSKLNQNLLLCDTLIDIKKNRNLLPKINDVSKNFDKENFSMAQLDAITTTSPLVMISAGAGCGKTKTIEGRIKYLIKSGINPEDITVLSFSNAAADNVKERQSAVKSMTIAKMIHTIYSENFKSHQIATLETFINMVKIQKSFKNVDDTTVNTFISNLYKILNNKDNGFMKMNSLIEDKYDEIIEILNTLKLTTLELEIMIAYQKIDTLKVPDSVKTKHIIIDEVQDNSIFEFAYALKYIKEFKSSLYLMGK